MTAQQSDSVSASQSDDVDGFWVVPDKVLEMANDWQDQTGAIAPPMPAFIEPWRDAAHYKAYVRPTETYTITEVTE